MYKRAGMGWEKHWDFILLDTVVQQFSLTIAYMLRHMAIRLPYADENYLPIFVLAGLLNLLVAIMYNTMHNVLKRGPWKEAKATGTQVAVTGAGLIVFMYALKISTTYSRLTVFCGFGFHFFLGYFTRRLYRTILLRRGKGQNAVATLVVASEKNAREILRHLGEHLNESFTVSGLVLADRDAAGEDLDGIPVVANLSDAADYICREWIDDVFLDVETFTEPINELLSHCQEMAVTVHIHFALRNDYKAKRFVEKFGGFDVVTSCVTFASTASLAAKRVLDILGGIVGSIIALLIMAVVGPMIKKASPGPIIYRSTRIGQNGKRFKMFKIRSMYPDAEKRKQELMAQNRVADGMMFKLDFDPRIIGNEILPDGTRKTGIGEFIRRTSLDEFPQFFNVLLGDMSLVGTRPPTPDEWDKYKYHHRARLATKPGITGMWQVSGRSEITDFEEVVKLDTEYINNWSFGRDIKILLQTVVAVLQRKGAM